MRLIDVDALLDSINTKEHGDLVGFNYEFIRDIIINAPTVQREGWVSVPIEPTPEMIKRAFHLSQNPNTLIKDIYKVMLKAAPKE